MNSGTENLWKSFDPLGVNKLAQQPSRIWSSTRKYSGTISIASVIATLIAFTTFSIQPVTVSIAGFVFTPAPLAFIPLTILLFTAVINFINTQKIKENEIDKKIGNYQVDEQYSKIAQEANKIEIVTNLDRKGKKLSIVLPISKMQREILEDIEADNRNRIFLFTGSYVFGAIIVTSAIARSTVLSPVLLVVLVAIALCSFITLNKLRSNSIDHENKIVRKFSTLDVLLPWRKGTIVSVMENKFESKEKDDFQSQALRLFDKHLTNLINRVCYLFDNSFLKPSNVNIQETLDGMKKDVKTLLDNLEESIKQNVDGVEATANAAIIQCLENIDKSVDKLCKGVGKDVQKKLDKISIKDLVNNISRLAETLEDRISRLKPGARMGLAGATFADERLSNASGGRENDQLPQDEQASSDKEPDAQRVDWAERVKEIGQLKKKIKALERALEKKENNQNQSENGASSETSSTTSNDVLRDEEEMLDKELAQLEKEERIEEKREKIKNLKEARPEQEKTDKWKEKINGKASEFLYYLLESIKLEEKDDKEKKVGEATLRNFDNKVIIHWKNGSQTTCHINKQGDLQIQPSTKIDFVDENIQAALKVACAG